MINQWPPAGVKWYYTDEWVAIAHGDCREILPLLPKVDLVLTDPPYGLNTKMQGVEEKYCEIAVKRLSQQVFDLRDSATTGGKNS